jgi:hypothetical protein
MTATWSSVAGGLRSEVRDEHSAIWLDLRSVRAILVSEQRVGRRLPITYQIDVNRRLIRTAAVGRVNPKEVINHFWALARDPLFPERPDVFLDVSAVESPPHAQELSIVVGEMKRIGAKLRFGACAIMASRDALFGMMRMFEALAEEFFLEMRTFRDATEAEQWLAERRSPAERTQGE